MAIVTVGKDEKAPKGLKPGDKVITAGGTYTITGNKPGGGYTSQKVTNSGSNTNNPNGGKTPTTTTKRTSGGGSSSTGGSSSGVNPATVTQYAATIYRPDGTVAQGYNRNGQTFYADGKRVEVGDTVRSTNGKYYTMTANGGVENSSFTPGTGGVKNSSFAPGTRGVPPALPPLEAPIQQLRPQSSNVLNNANSVLDQYTVDQLVQLFGPGVEASYNTLENEAKRTLGAFDQGIFQIGNNNIEAVKRMHGTAATGAASQAAAGAQALSALMNTFMDAAPVFTEMNQEMQGLSAKKAEAMANLVPTAVQVKNTQDSNFANLFNSLYAADTQFGVGALDYLGNKYNADKNLEGNKYASDKNLEGTIQQALANIKASQSYGGGGGGGSTYNPNASFDGYMSKAEAAVANGDRGAFLMALTGAGVSTKEAQDLWDEMQRKDLEDKTNFFPQYPSLGEKVKAWADSQGKMFYTDQHGVMKLNPKAK